MTRRRAETGGKPGARPRARSVLALALALALGSLFAGGTLADPALIEPGRQIYFEGRVGETALSARRAGGLVAQGSAVACVNCHRRSALGGAEGRTYVPPINAGALFNPVAPGTGGAAAGLGRAGYTEATLAQALNHGSDPAGRPLDALMPRYAFDPGQLHALMAYLRAQDEAAAPGVSDAGVALATVVAGDVSPARRHILRSTLNACAAEHNGGVAPPPRRKRLAGAMAFAAPRPWTLHVWELHGPATGWAAQLAARSREQPVFAVVGGVLGSLNPADWSAVHQFCEAQRLPCLYPHLEAPPSATDGAYTLYTHAGVRLEGELIAHALRIDGARRVVQWLRPGDGAAREGAAALRAALAGQAVQVEERDFDTFDGTALSSASAHVLWLRDDDLARVEGAAGLGPRLFASASLLEHRPERVPASLRPRVTLAHPHEIGAQRAARRRELEAWLGQHGLALEDEPLQADLMLACKALQLGLDEVAPRPQADALIERLESLSERRGFAGLYPHLSLGSGQRLASKTGYLVRFSAPDGTQLEALGDALAP